MVGLAATWILAHQGGWDEILFVLAPLIVFAGLLLLARRRVEGMEHGEPAPDANPAGDDREPVDPT